MGCAFHCIIVLSHLLVLGCDLMHACGAQGGSFAYLTPAFAIIAQIKARGAWVDAADGTNHARFLVRWKPGFQTFTGSGHLDSASGISFARYPRARSVHNSEVPDRCWVPVDWKVLQPFALVLPTSHVLLLSKLGDWMCARYRCASYRAGSLGRPCSSSSWASPAC